MSLKVRADRPVDPVSVAVMQVVSDAATHLGMKTFMVGATARTILLEHVYGLAAGRATRDIDFAFVLESWEQFQALKAYLICTASFEPSARAVQRLAFNPPSMSNGIVVDLIPFGALESEAHIISWPPEMSTMMNVAGYRDAHRAAVAVEIAPALTISLASISGIAILKFFAWMDRGREDPKDAIDLVTLFRQYHQAGNQDRIYESATEALEDVGYDLELAGVWLLGRDAAMIALPDSRKQLAVLFADQASIDRLVTDMSRATRTREGALAYARALLEQFLRGFLADLA